MSNVGVIVLESKKIQSKPELCATRLQIEDNIGEAIHVHWRNLRLDFSIRDFLALADLCLEIKYNFKASRRQNSENNGTYDICKHEHGNQNFSNKLSSKSFSIAPHFFEAMGDLVNHIVEVKVDTVPLDDLLSITYLSKNPNFWKADSIVESKPYQCLTGNANAYEKYVKLLGNPKYSKENIYNLMTSIEKNGYPYQNNFIVVFENEPYIRDGQHRAAILRYLYGNIRIPVLKLIFKNGYYGWRMNRSLRKKPDKVTMNQPQKIIWVRTDAIGDNILAASMLSQLKKIYYNAKIIVVCQEHIHEFYETCPSVDQIISFDKMQAYCDENYRVKLITDLQELQADLALNSVYSREPITDLITIGSIAKETVAFGCDVENSFGMSLEILEKNNQHYTKLIKSVENSTIEQVKYQTFLRHIGIEASDLKPVIWLKHEDEEFARRFFENNKLQPDKTIALFPGAQNLKRVYEHYDDILKDFENYNILILGGNNEVIMAKKIAKSFKGKSCVMAGRTTIRQTASIIKKCRLFLGSESCGAHIACAVGTPNIVIIGGGHFGRFMPYSELTSLVCLPLDCYGCGWKCCYQRPHCIKDISPDVIIKSVKQIIEKPSKRGRIFVQSESYWESGYGKPKWFSSEVFKKVDSTEIIPIEKTFNSINRIEVNDYIDNQKKMPI